MQTSDRYLVFSAAFLIFALMFGSLVLRPIANRDNLDEATAVGVESIVFRKVASTKVYEDVALIADQRGGQCMLRPPHAQRLKELMRPDSELSVLCKTAPDFRGTHEVYELTVDGVAIVDVESVIKQKNTDRIVNGFLAMLLLFISILLLRRSRRLPAEPVTDGR